MKKSVFITIFALLSVWATAQEENFRTVFGNRQHISHGGYGALTFSYGSIYGKDAFMTGIKGGWVIDHILTLGIAGNGFINDISYNNQLGNNEDLNLAGGYGGLLIEPVLAPFSPVHLAFPVIIGAGGVSLVNYNWWQYDSFQNPAVWESDAFFVIEPGVEIEFNVVRFMRLAIGASYRHTSAVHLSGMDQDVLNGLNAGFSLKFGKF